MHVEWKVWNWKNKDKAQSKITEMPQMYLLKNLETTENPSFPVNLSSARICSTWKAMNLLWLSAQKQHNQAYGLLLPTQTTSMKDMAESPTLSNMAHRSTQANAIPISHRQDICFSTTVWAFLSVNLSYSLGFRSPSSPHCSTILESSVTHSVLTSAWCISPLGRQHSDYSSGLQNFVHWTLLHTC